MYLSGHNVKDMVESKIHIQGLKAKLKLINLEKSMSNGTKVLKRNGQTESLNLDKGS